jgi:sugar-specific transcriptional regulator TrmB
MEKSVYNKVVTFLKHLGLDSEQAALYLYLQQHGQSTVLALSRGLDTGRTKLYPALEEMVAKQVVAVHERHYGTTYEALPPQNLEFLVAEAERKASGLRHDLGATLHALSTLAKNTGTTTRVIEYKGIDGLKQMNWNLAKKASKSYKVFELSTLSEKRSIGAHFAKKMYEIEEERRLVSYDLTNDKNRVSKQLTYSPHRHNFAYIDPAIFTIEFETMIYNDVIALLSFENDDIFGVEIHNQKLARQQEQLFDLLWKQSTPL